MDADSALSLVTCCLSPLGSLRHSNTKPLIAVPSRQFHPGRVADRVDKGLPRNLHTSVLAQDAEKGRPSLEFRRAFLFCLLPFRSFRSPRGLTRLIEVVQ